MAPVVKELEKNPDFFKSIICVTAQHRQMLDRVLNLFEIKPDYDLNSMEQGQDLIDLTSNILLGLKSVLERERPDIVLVHGDTSTTMAASLAACYFRIPVGHVEAGLRTHNKHAPFPEEIHRRVTGVLADIHFAPTEAARSNLLSEGVSDDTIHVTGNTVIDALFSIVTLIESNPVIRTQMEQQFSYLDPTKLLLLVTCHRRENFGHDLENICYALATIAEQNPTVEILFPVHPNPNVQEPVTRILGGENHPNIYLIEPVDYLTFIYLMNRSYLILTDSGGVQEEAPSLGKPVLVLRESTERMEAVVAGTVRLVGTDQNIIIRETLRLIDDKEAYQTMSRVHNPIGNGQSAKQIVDLLKMVMQREAI